MTNRSRIGVALLCLSALVGASACGSSPAERRKAAQANGDKYMEFLKVGDYEGAYHKTFSTQYRQAMPVETWVRFRQGFAQVVGEIKAYEVVRVESQPNRPYVKVIYSVTTEKYPVPVTEVVSLVLEGTEWRVANVDSQRPPLNTNANNAGAPTQLPLPKTGP